MLQILLDQGPVNAIRILQKVLLAHGKHVGKIDGHCGCLTMLAAKSVWDDIGVDLLKILNKRYAILCKSHNEHHETPHEQTQL
ncbi:hypothetical protein [Methylomonas albis]|uniref:Transposase n=1 Tax=Methylomonas albis TaxID=1854563 RepID=A0ABR9CZU9_9GAMM|nr:hypothetical protein [Methylomonas albis]MBD9356357.1 hypothetical protein [Methylomonas albis]